MKLDTFGTCAILEAHGLTILLKTWLLSLLTSFIFCWCFWFFLPVPIVLYLFSQLLWRVKTHSFSCPCCFALPVYQCDTKHFGIYLCAHAFSFRYFAVWKTYPIQWSEAYCHVKREFFFQSTVLKLLNKYVSYWNKDGISYIIFV